MASKEPHHSVAIVLHKYTRLIVIRCINVVPLGIFRKIDWAVRLNFGEVFGRPR